MYGEVRVILITALPRIHLRVFKAVTVVLPYERYSTFEHWYILIIIDVIACFRCTSLRSLKL